MYNSTKFYLIEASALPEVFLKVAEANRLLATGEVSTVNAATQRVGLSRSAFYKYRDAMQPFNDMKANPSITFQFLLHDAPGVLTAVMNILTECHANLRTVNSIAPTNGCAFVTITVETANITVSVDEIMHLFLATQGVIKCEILAAV